VKIGDKVIFRGTRIFWFTNMIDNGNKLTIGQEYTISSIITASSWTGITLNETGDLEYNASWFDKVKDNA
jgi:hypothetical protein